MKTVDNGFYRHFKGREYEVIGTSTHTETNEKMVMYKDESNIFWVRPIDMFLSYVEVDDAFSDKKIVKPRFEKVMVFVIDTKFGYLGRKDKIYAGRGMSWSGGDSFVGLKDAKKYEQYGYDLEKLKEDMDRQKMIGATIELIHKQSEY